MIFVIFRSQLYVLAPALGLEWAKHMGESQGTRQGLSPSIQQGSQDSYVSSHLGQLTSHAWGGSFVGPWVAPLQKLIGERRQEGGGGA